MYFKFANDRILATLHFPMETSCKICGDQYSTGACTENKKDTGKKIQFLPRFEELKGGQVDKQGKYTEPSLEQKVEIERRLDQLGDIMDGANFDYHLDGAINVSFLHNKFIRYHKDVDISIVYEDLEALDKQLKMKNHVIVYANRDNFTDTHQCLEIVSAKEITQRKLDELQLAKVDSNGIIRDFIDLHVHPKDKAGNITIENSGVVFPAKYFQKDKKYYTQGGHEIPVSHPVVVAYHKVESGRDYDFHDISYLKEYLSDEDVAFLTNVFKQEPERKLQQYLPAIKKMFAGINPGMRPDEIMDQMEKSGISKESDGKAFIAEFPDILKTDPAMNEKQFVALFMEKLKLKEKLDARAKEKLDKLYKALDVR